MKKVTRLEPKDSQALIELFREIEKDALSINFHPHPFTRSHAIKIANNYNKDFYLGLFNDNKMLGYGMLRGWNEGFKIPALGIYIRSAYRGTGLSTFFMNEIHRFAREQSALKVMLKVYPENTAALMLYKKMGYEFNQKIDNQIVGYLSLK
jgi:ribosomal-protein-alanine N-acetyltransferase